MRVPSTVTHSVALCALLAVSFAASGGSAAEEPAAAGSPAASPIVVAPHSPAAAAPTPAAERVANVESAPAAEPPKVETDHVGTALRSLLAETPPKLAEADKEDRAAAAAFYSAGSSQLWVAKSGFTDRARAVMAEFDKAADWGLSPAEFGKPTLAAAPSDADLADAELKLTLAVLKYARHARGGRIPDPTSQLSSYLDRKPQLLAPRDVLDGIAKATGSDKTNGADAYLRGLHPRHPQFVKLREELVAMRASGGADNPVLKVPQGPTIQPGQSHPDVAVIRKRLEVVAIVGADGEAIDETFYDGELAKAVAAFQAERGIKASKGAITAATRTALNTEAVPPVNARKIVAAMEAWRWMPDDMGDLHVWVNIPEFTVRVVKGGEVIHAERVITGKVDTQTPIFSDVMETVVIHPFWGVPESIKVKELYPGLARGGDTLSKNGLRLQQNGRDVAPGAVDWTTANIKNFHIYQPPGPGNVLGVVKFLFPNKHQVYMHDTPTKHLFATAMRTYSHGCMRVRNPVRLAEVLLGEDKGWDSARIAGLIKGGPQNNEIGLSRKIPVHVTYFTTWVDEAGKLGSSRDFYGHEGRITMALDGKWNQIARGKDHLAPVRAEPIAHLAESSAKYKPSNALGDFFKTLFGGAN